MPFLFIGRKQWRRQTRGLDAYAPRHEDAQHFYRAMHFSAKRGIAIACRLSVCPSVCDVGEL